MDDIYFSDKRRRRSSGEDGHLPKERFTHSNHFDIEKNPDGALRRDQIHRSPEDVSPQGYLSGVTRSAPLRLSCASSVFWSEDTSGRRAV